jgi:hypothetical protein
VIGFTYVFETVQECDYVDVSANFVYLFLWGLEGNDLFFIVSEAVFENMVKVIGITCVLKKSVGMQFP